MRKRIKYLIKIIAIPTIFWLFLLLIFHYVSSDGHIGIKRLAGDTIVIPLFTMHMVIILGYVASVIIGFLLFYQKIVWKEF